MKVGIPRERADGECRVALVPESVKKLVGSGAAVVVERGAGEGSFASDEQYTQAGATLGSADEAFGADIVVKVAKPTADEITKLQPGAVLITTLQPLTNHDLVKALAERKVTSLSMDSIPRVTRAQPMDSLSSQSNIAGYKAVLNAAAALPRFFPMLTTAAGTVTPARVFVIGAGVAGLQAIATARRLGAVVEAFDTRPVVKEQVQSLGAKFIEIDLGQSGEGTGGYARELTPEEQQKQRELMAERVAAADVVITTALVPGRKAPILITADVIRRMRPGSVIIDLAAEMGGNAELTKPGEVNVVNGVRIDGTLNLPSTVSAHASQLYSRNIASLLALVLKDGKLDLDPSDEIVKGAVITQGGEVVHGPTKSAMAPKP